MSIKVRDLAKELGISEEKLMDQLMRLYVDVEDGGSKIDEKIANLVRVKMAGSPGALAKKKAAGEKKAKEEAEVASKKRKADSAKKAEKAKEDEAAAAKELKRAEKEAAKEAVVPETAPVSPEQKVEAEPAKIVPQATFPGGGKPTIEKVYSAPVEEKTSQEAKEEKPKKPEKVEWEYGDDGVKRKKKPIIRPLGGDEAELEEYIPDINKYRKWTSGKKDNRIRPIIEIIEKGEVVKTTKGSSGVPAAKHGAKVEAPKEPVKKGPQKIEMQIPVSVRNLAMRINIKPAAVIQYLMKKGAAVNINQELEEDAVRDIMLNFGFELHLPETSASIEKEFMEERKQESKVGLERRAPVVTFMGHVDHGKTSLLDYIRKTMVAKGEKGGITQHIGAYKVETAKGSVTFLDTPGHAAFTAMRARGANATDVVVLVVAADDGVMPQTKEAIDHARAAGVPIVVAINKCDLPTAAPDKVKVELQKEGLMSEKWGGKTIMVEVSAVTGDGVDELVELLMLESEMLELKANPKLRARGVVVESRKTPSQGVVATLLVQNGTLHAGDIIVCGAYYGKVKAMMNNLGKRIDAALPSTPVEVIGLQGVPQTGEEFFVVKDEKRARTLAALKQSENRTRNMVGRQRLTLEDLHAKIAEGVVKELNLIIKADVQGSEEALKASLEELSVAEVKVRIIHSAVGNITDSDVTLALVSNAIIIGFHVKVEPSAEDIAKNEKVDVRVYEIIYEAIADVQAGMEGLLEPEEREVYQGSAQILEIFSAKNSKAAGCMATKGVIHRKDRVRVKRAQEVIYDGEINALKRFKDDVKEVKEGFEFGLSFKGFNDIKKNDIIEAYMIEKVSRRLEKR